MRVGIQRLTFLLSLAARSTKTKKKSAMPRRTPKHRQRSSSTISEEQVAHHVAHRYLHGSGGALRQAQIRSNRRLTDTTGESQSSFLKKLDRHPALLLNADYQPMSSLPLSLWNWQEAVKAVFSGKVTVVDVYEDVTIRAANLQVALPSVIALNEYVPQFNQVSVIYECAVHSVVLYDVKHSPLVCFGWSSILLYFII